MTTAVLLVRHAAYRRATLAGGSESTADLGLSDLGRAQAHALARRLRDAGDPRPDALYCSTLPRARETAAVIAPAWNLAPQPMHELCEWESGNESMPADDFAAAFDALSPSARRRHRFQPGCETIAEFTDRIRGALDALTAAHAGGTCALVVHGGVIEAAFQFFLGYGPGLFEGGYPAAGHTSLTRWERAEAHGTWVQAFANDTHHLRGLV